MKSLSVGASQKTTDGAIIHRGNPRRSPRAGSTTIWAAMKTVKSPESGSPAVNMTVSSFSCQRIRDRSVRHVYFLRYSMLPCVHFPWRFLNAR